MWTSTTHWMLRQFGFAHGLHNLHLSAHCGVRQDGRSCQSCLGQPLTLNDCSFSTGWIPPQWYDLRSRFSSPAACLLGLQTLSCYAAHHGVVFECGVSRKCLALTDGITSQHQLRERVAGVLQGGASFGHCGSPSCIRCRRCPEADYATCGFRTW